MTRVVRKSPSSGLKTGFTHPCTTMHILSASVQADIFRMPNEFLLLLTPNMHEHPNNSPNWERFQCGKIALFFNPEEGDFLATRVI